MAAYPLDSWKSLFPVLDAWKALTPGQRHELLALPQTYTRSSAYAMLRDLEPGLTARLIESDPAGRMRPTAPAKKLRVFMERLRAWCLPGKFDVTAFVNHYSIFDQRYALTGAQGLSQSVVTAAFCKSFQDGVFTRKILDSRSRLHFLDSVGGWVPHGIEFSGERYQALKDWLMNHHAAQGPTFQIESGIFSPSPKGVEPEEVLYLALAYGAVFIGIKPDTREVFVRIAAPRSQTAQDPGQLVFHPITPRESWSRPFLLEDMETYLRALKSEPAPLLSDANSIPVAHHRKIARTFAPLPYGPDHAGFAEEARARTAWWMLRELHLVETTGKSRKSWRAHPGPRADAWLAGSRQSRLEDLLALAPCGIRKRHTLDQRFEFLGDFEANPFPYSALNARLMTSMDAFYALLEKPVGWEAALIAANGHANPFVADMEKDRNLLGHWTRWESSPQQVYHSLLHQYGGRLASLGALAFHHDAEGRLGASLTEVGRWLYGRVDRWSLPSTERQVAVVGGDFTVTLLEPAPDFLLELRMFAEPVAANAEGSTWRITRVTVQAAAHRGLDAAWIIKTLRAWSKHALPANVVHEVEHWAGARRGVRLSEVLLLEGQDPLTVAEMLSAFPKDLERVGPSALKAKPGTKRAALIKKLAKRGFFLE